MRFFYKIWERIFRSFYKIKLKIKLTKVEMLIAVSELMHRELQNFIKEANIATGHLLIEKSSVDFFEPYLTLVENEMK